MAKLIYENSDYEQEVSIKLDKDANIYEFLEVCEKLCLAIGYHPDSIEDGITQRAIDLEEQNAIQGEQDDE